MDPWGKRSYQNKSVADFALKPDPTTARPSNKPQPLSRVTTDLDLFVIGSLGFAFRNGHFVAVHFVG